MLDLTNETMADYWAAVSPAANSVIAAMDACEDWRTENDDVSTSQLSELFTSIPERFLRVGDTSRQLEFINDLLVLLAYLPSSKALYLAHWLDQSLTQQGYDFLRKLNELYETASPSQIDRVGLGLLRARIRFVRKTLVLQTVFAPERLNMLAAAVGKGSEDKL